MAHLALSRVSGWETAFAEYLAAATARVEAEEQNLCAMFVAGAVEAITGVDPAKGLRGKARAVRAALEETFDGLFPTVPVALAQRGDIAWHDGAVGVIIGGEALFVGRDPNDRPALVRVARAEWEKAWAVGHE